jgi:hypothetical protein
MCEYVWGGTTWYPNQQAPWGQGLLETCGTQDCYFQLLQSQTRETRLTPSPPCCDRRGNMSSTWRSAEWNYHSNVDMDKTKSRTPPCKWIPLRFSAIIIRYLWRLIHKSNFDKSYFPNSLCYYLGAIFYLIQFTLAMLHNISIFAIS